jgi:molybdopterin/thiamine biosynthesis adenylyltransferase
MIAIRTIEHTNDSANLDGPQWSYDEAFKRNLGLISDMEQQKLRQSRVAIAGMGGVGGLHLITLARLGIGNFTIADPDVFEVGNFNRQYGATISNLGRNKAEAMAEMVLDINPEINIRVFAEPIHDGNVDEFLADADIYVDGIDLYAVDARRVIFKACRERNLWALTAGPMGFSTGWVAFDPDGMTFDQYFDLAEGMSELDKLIAFVVGLCPRALHLSHLDVSCVKPEERAAPSVSSGCQLATGVMGSLVAKALTGRGLIRAAPYYHQFDAYRQKFVQARLRGGNRHPMQRMKRWWLHRTWKDRFNSQESR